MTLFIRKHLRARWLALPMIVWASGCSDTALDPREDLAHLLVDGVAAGGDSGAGDAAGDGIPIAADIPQTPSQWIAAASMSEARVRHTATLLDDGTVLVIGGYAASKSKPIALAERYDPKADKWSSAGEMIVPRAFHKAVKLDDGRVLVVGGVKSSSNQGAVDVPAVLFDPTAPSDKAWSETKRKIPNFRQSHDIVKLVDGRVAVFGGFDNLVDHRQIDIYDPAGDKWVSSKVTLKRNLGTATLLDNGKVVLMGGTVGDEFVDKVEVFTPGTDAIAASVVEVASPLDEPRASPYAIKLDDGRAMLIGGYIGLCSGFPCSGTTTIEFFDPKTDEVKAGLSGPSNFWESAIVGLEGGRILLVGDFRGSNRCWVINARGDQLQPTADALTGRSEQAAVLLADGRVLMTGGTVIGEGPTNATGIYTPGVD